MNKMHTIIAAAAALTLAACDAHIETPDMTVRPGHVLCDDGTALSYAQYKASGKQAVAVVFDTGQHDGTEGNGYAVYLWDIAPQAFADSLGVEQGTSADTEAFDGNENTFALYDTQETASPMAAAVFDLWCYGQSAYIPSVAQMRLLYAARETVNPVLELCGGDTLPADTTATAGTGLRRKSRDSRPPRRGSTRQAAEPCRKLRRYRRTGCVPLSH